MIPAHITLGGVAAFLAFFAIAALISLRQNESRDYTPVCREDLPVGEWFAIKRSWASARRSERVACVFAAGLLACMPFYAWTAPSLNAGVVGIGLCWLCISLPWLYRVCGPLPIGVDGMLVSEGQIRVFRGFALREFDRTSASTRVDSLGQRGPFAVEIADADGKRRVQMSSRSVDLLRALGWITPD